MKTFRAIMTDSSTVSCFSRLFLLLFATTVGLFFAACSPKSPPQDPRTAPISAAAPKDFAKWQGAAFAIMSPAEREEFERGLNELRNQIRNEIRARNEVIDEGVVTRTSHERIHGKTIREVLIMAYTSEVERIPRELAQRRELLAQADARLDGDSSEEAKSRVRSYRVAVAHVVDNLEKQLARARARLEELQGDAAAAP